MRRSLCGLALFIMTGFITSLGAYASQDIAPTVGTPDGRGSFPILFEIELENPFSVGVGFRWTNCSQGGRLWVSAGDQHTGQCEFYIYDEYGTLVDQVPQGAGAIDWGHRDMASNGDYMFGSYSQSIDGYSDPHTYDGYFVGPLNPNRAMAHDGDYFYTCGFSEPLTRMTWDGNWGSVASSEMLTGPIDGAYGLAYDGVEDCLWMSTADYSGNLYKYSTDGFLLDIYSTAPEYDIMGGCTMALTEQFGYVLVVLVQSDPDKLVFYDLGHGFAPGPWWPFNVIHVRPDGTGDYPTIQAAINATTAVCNIVELADGVYTGDGNRDIEYGGRDITVRSASGDPSSCIIDCQGSMSSNHRGFWFSDGEGPEAVLQGVTVKNGYIYNGRGGGVLVGSMGIGFPPEETPAHPTFINCVFSDNSVSGLLQTRAGGGVACIYGSSPAFDDCVFANNSSSGVGGGGSIGGGLSFDGAVISRVPTLEDCGFYENTANAGGGMVIVGAKPELTNCMFSGNSGTQGGGVYANQSMYSLEYCTFSGNTVTAGGGGLFGYGFTPFPPTITNCTFSGNAAYVGGALGFSSNGRASLARTIMAFSTSGDAVNCAAGCNPTFTCCDIYGNAGGPGYAGSFIGSSNNFAEYPGFCDAGNEDFTIRSVSPCAPANSPCGQLVGAWPVGCINPMTFLVCPDGTGDFTTIQAAIDASASGDILELCDATFMGNGNRDLDYGGRAITIRSQSGTAQGCVIDCQGTQANPHRAFYFHSGEGASSVLENVSIVHGYHDYRGGGIYCDGASPTITNVIFDENWGYNGGGVACDDGATPTLTYCIFSRNGAIDGGGVACGGSTYPLVDSCEFYENTVTYDAAGLWCVSAWPTVVNCFFHDNTAMDGGAIQVQGVSNPTIVDCFFKENIALSGGAISTYALGSPIDHCTFAGNTATGGGGGGAMYCGNNTSLVLVNCTLSGNAATGGGSCGGGVLVDWNSNIAMENTIIAFSTAGEAVCCSPGCSATLSCCDLFGNAGGDWVGCVAAQFGLSGNISLDPLFCNAANNDFTLHSTSPCAPFSPPNPECDLIGAWPVGCWPGVDWADHDVGDCILTMTDCGILGFMDGTQNEGSGFIYPADGSNLLYIGGLWVGESTTYVANRDYDDDPAKEWIVSSDPDGHVWIDLDGTSDQDIHASYTDGAAAQPRGLFVDQESWAFGRNRVATDHVIVHYTILNEGVVPLSDLYVGVFLDFDFEASPQSTGGVDSTLHLTYMADPSGLHAGVQWLDDGLGTVALANLTLVHNPTYVYPNQYVLDADKYMFLSAADAVHIMTQASQQDDYSVLASAGPIDLAPGEEQRVSFAILGGESLYDLKQHAVVAQLIMTSGFADVPEEQLDGFAGGTRLMPCAPNPFQRETTIRFDLARPGAVDVGVYDVGGRLVRTLACGWHPAMQYVKTWDGRDGAGREVPGGVYFLRLSADEKRETRRLIRLK